MNYEQQELGNRLKSILRESTPDIELKHKVYAHRVISKNAIASAFAEVAELVANTHAKLNFCADGTITKPSLKRIADNLSSIQFEHGLDSLTLVCHRGSAISVEATVKSTAYYQGMEMPSSMLGSSDIWDRVDQKKIAPSVTHTTAQEVVKAEAELIELEKIMKQTKASIETRKAYLQQFI